MQQEEGLVNKMYENRIYLIFSMSEIDIIDFEQILQTSNETIRKSIDQTKAVISWNNQIPNFVESLTTKSQFYTHEEILQIMNTPEWKEPDLY